MKCRSGVELSQVYAEYEVMHNLSIISIENEIYTGAGLIVSMNMIEYISNTFNSENVMDNLIWIAIGVLLQFVISKAINKLKVVFLCDERKIINRLSEHDKSIIKEHNFESYSNANLEKLESLGIIKINYNDVNVTDASGENVLFITRDKNNPNIGLTNIGERVKYILNKKNKLK